MTTPTYAIVKKIIGDPLPVTEQEFRTLTIQSINGEFAFKGNSDVLGNSLDFNVLLGLRMWSDAVLVGGATVRKENYGGVKIPLDVQEERVSRGQAAIPPIVVVTRTLDFDITSRLFCDADVMPLFLVDETATIAPEVVQTVESTGASVYRIDTNSPEAIVNFLHSQSLNRIDCEAGPRLLSAFLEAGYVDVIHHHIAPKILPAGSRNAGSSQTAGSNIINYKLELVHASGDGLVFLRYRKEKCC